MMKKNKKATILLFIDTSSNKEISVGLEIDGKAYLQKRSLDKQKAQAVLPMIDELLKKHGLKLDALTEIKINTGPGSFTGLRVGVSIANALGMMLQIPVNGKKVGELVEPAYD
jgi:tRNA threonylcarbamoyladenosine biosynthesis protein TsaB